MKEKGSRNERNGKCFQIFSIYLFIYIFFFYVRVKCCSWPHGRIFFVSVINYFIKNLKKEKKRMSSNGDGWQLNLLVTNVGIYRLLQQQSIRKWLPSAGVCNWKVCGVLQVVGIGAERWRAVRHAISFFISVCLSLSLSLSLYLSR